MKDNLENMLKPDDLKKAEKELIEKLASIEHDRWGRWHKHAAKNWNVAMVSRWNQQADTPYHQLSESEKESDRREVMEYWPLIKVFIAAEREKAVRDTLNGAKEKLKKWATNTRLQFGCDGKHHGVGSEDCSVKPHHHHDGRCVSPWEALEGKPK